MELLLDKTELSTLNVPKLSRSTFEMKNNYFVVTDGSTFNYFTIKVKDFKEQDPLIRFDRSPPILLEGLAVINKKIYHVTIQDLLRRIIRKSREVKRDTIDANVKRNTRNQSTAVGTDVNTTSTISGENKSGTSTETEMEINEIANTTWSEQIGSLLDFISEKEGEEWEITSTP